MSLTLSSMLPLGTAAPDFSLPNLNGEFVSINDFKDSKAYLIAFICVHCPYVKHLEREFASLASKYMKKSVAVIAINSNDPRYDPDDDLGGMVQQAAKYCFSFPYLVDKSQDVAKLYQAACTPDVYVFDENKKLGGHPTGKHLKDAIDAVLNKKTILKNQKPSSGCNIKWNPGNEPKF